MHVQVQCGDNAVYVYEGLAPSVGRYPGSRLLASLCTEDLPEEEITMEASTGIMTIYYAEVTPGVIRKFLG